MEFPDDATVSELTTQWMDGDKLMVAPVIKQDNTSVYTFRPAHGTFSWCH